MEQIDKKEYEKLLSTLTKVELESEKVQKSVFKDLTQDNILRYGIVTSSTRVNSLDFQLLNNICLNLSDSNPIFSSVLGILSEGTLSPYGPSPQPKIKKKNGTMWTDLNDRVLSLWEDYNDYVYSEAPLREMFLIEEQTKDLVGNVFKVRVANTNEDSPFSHQIKYFDSTNLDSTKDTLSLNDDGSYVKFGIKYDKNDKPVEYYFKDNDAIPASQVIHYFTPKYLNQKVGISVFAPVITTILDLKTLVNSSAKAAVNSANMSFWLKPDSDIAKKINISESIVYTEDSMMFLTENKPENIGGNTQLSDMTVKMTKQILQIIAAGVELSYSTVARDLEGESFSGGRIRTRLDLQTFSKRFKQFSKRNFQKNYDWFIQDIFLSGKFQKILGVSPTDYLVNKRNFHNVRCFVKHPVYDDPVKQATYDNLRIKNGQVTMKELLEAEGKDWREHNEQLALEAKDRREKGIELEKDTVHFEINTSDGQEDLKNE